MDSGSGAEMAKEKVQYGSTKNRQRERGVVGVGRIAQE